MAAMTFFLATSKTDKRLTKEELIALTLDLLHTQLVQLPAAICAGQAYNEPRTDDNGDYPPDYDERYEEKYILPNAPDTMVRLMKQRKIPEATYWYYGDNEEEFINALKNVPLEEKDVCICFENLHADLTESDWDGAVIYALRHPFPNTFIDVFDSCALPLVGFDVAHFFTLFSYRNGAFKRLDNNPLFFLLKRYFGPNDVMRQTASLEEEQ
ncbi:hypothetical protein KSC_077070 [Ktedonobacter sp. SOSP1-52]|uniref:hypothetical protein n=1 Tax=Ktedonobacter sp. SOSP1-52 TaxID=2778366 RepID=UPI0019165767|nr:hypothetical protein [Ktedonobacter sp. SOSP1-52]GHO68815.1 hypothetical protein KSC_077070 [Ktedonobacter sp. SOSP1-52]